MKQNMAKTKLTIGADPEYFFSVKENGVSKPVPACGLFGGTKRAPVFISSEGGFLEDGCAVEFNVSPSATLRETREKLGRLYLIFSGMFPKYEILPYHSSVQFSRKELRDLAQANIIGCDADTYAYGIRDKPQISSFKNYRFAGGHIHIGLDPWPEQLDKNLFVRYLDLVMLAPYLSHCDINRFPFYGHLGLYREKSYGVEYRSPDNFWAVPNLQEISNIVSKTGIDKSVMANDFIDRVDNNLKNFVEALHKLGPDFVNGKLAAYLQDGQHFSDLFSSRKARLHPFSIASSSFSKYSSEIQKAVCGKL